MGTGNRRAQSKSLSPKLLTPKQKGTGCGPTHRRTTVLSDDILDVRTRKLALFEFTQLMLFEVGTPPRRATRTWHPRNIGELLLGTGWKSLEEKTVWCSLTNTKAAKKLPLRDLFCVEIPFAYAWIADKYRMDIARLYPGRVEFDTCDKAHRIAILDIAAEDQYRPRGIPEHCYELLVEKICPCFHDGTTAHEGDLVLYRWR